MSRIRFCFKLVLLGTLALGPAARLSAQTPMPNITINGQRLQSSVIYRTAQFKPPTAPSWKVVSAGRASAA
jgi:hypothetical protein